VAQPPLAPGSSNLAATRWVAERVRSATGADSATTRLRGNGFAADVDIVFVDTTST
jgi:hypothetical protein